jgi:GLPGLI family protein
MGKKAGINISLLAGMLMIIGFSHAQLITSGRIVFERKTNLEKKFDDARMKEWLGGKKVKIDEFELLFNDTISIFKPIESNEVDRMSWVTSRSTVVQNEKLNEKLFVLDVAGQQIFVKDTITARQWKITDSKRTIDKYRCVKAVYEKNDSTRLYAWFSVDIVPSIGPEGFGGLPGAILGLATEDGGIIYFAKSVEFNEPKAETFIVNTKKKELFTPESLKVKFEKEMGGGGWATRMYDEMFRWL